MKYLFALLFVVSFHSLTHAQETFYVGTGATYGISNVKSDFIDKAGYYIAIGTTKKLSDKSGYLGEIQFINEHSGEFKNNSVNGTFAYRYFPISNLSINAGFQIGVYTSDNVNPEIAILSKGKMDGIAGVAYSLKRFEISARYNHALNREVFKGFYQLGVSYSLNTIQ